MICTASETTLDLPLKHLGRLLLSKKKKGDLTIPKAQAKHDKLF